MLYKAYFEDGLDLQVRFEAVTEEDLAKLNVPGASSNYSKSKEDALMRLAEKAKAELLEAMGNIESIPVYVQGQE